MCMIYILNILSTDGLNTWIKNTETNRMNLKSNYMLFTKNWLQIKQNRNLHKNIPHELSLKVKA